MTLPFSDKPEKSSIYQDVKTETLQELTPDQFDAFKARMFAEGVNGLEDEYRRLLLLGLASDKIGISGPMPKTSQIINVTASASGSNVEIFTAGEGEVWQVMGLSYIVDTISGTVSHLVTLDGVYPGAPGGTVVISEKSSTDAGDNFGDIDFSPLHLDENVKLQYTAYGTFNSVSVRAALIRIR